MDGGDVCALHSVGLLIRRLHALLAILHLILPCSRLLRHHLLPLLRRACGGHPRSPHCPCRSCARGHINGVRYRAPDCPRCMGHRDLVYTSRVERDRHHGSAIEVVLDRNNSPCIFKIFLYKNRNFLRITSTQKSFNPSLIKSAKINLSNMILAIGSFHQNRLSINLLKSQNLISFHQKTISKGMCCRLIRL